MIILTSHDELCRYTSNRVNKLWSSCGWSFCTSPICLAAARRVTGDEPVSNKMNKRSSLKVASEIELRIHSNGNERGITVKSYLSHWMIYKHPRRTTSMSNCNTNSSCGYRSDFLFGWNSFWFSCRISSLSIQSINGDRLCNSHQIDVYLSE